MPGTKPVDNKSCFRPLERQSQAPEYPWGGGREGPGLWSSVLAELLLIAIKLFRRYRQAL